jgi:hypothetical protein
MKILAVLINQPDCPKPKIQPGAVAKLTTMKMLIL